jgi:timeless
MVCFSAVKVMVFLTMPIDPSSIDIPQQLEYLRQFKAAVLEDDAIGVIVSHLQEPLEHMERYLPATSRGLLAADIFCVNS